VFYITPPPPKPRVKKVDEEGNEVEEPDPEADMDPEELAKNSSTCWGNNSLSVEVSDSSTDINVDFIVYVKFLFLEW